MFNRRLKDNNEVLLEYNIELRHELKRMVYRSHELSERLAKLEEFIGCEYVKESTVPGHYVKKEDSDD